MSVEYIGSYAWWVERQQEYERADIEQRTRNRVAMNLESLKEELRQEASKAEKLCFLWGFVVPWRNRFIDLKDIIPSNIEKRLAIGLSHEEAHKQVQSLYPAVYDRYLQIKNREERAQDGSDTI